VARVRKALSRTVAELEHRARWRRSPLRRVTRAYLAAYGANVKAGPFRGLSYPPGVISHVTTAVPKLMGAYERELHGAIESLLETQPVRVITAGCADGYYAVGIARRLPAATVHAFDLEPHWRRICADVARENGVAERVLIGERLDARVMAELPLDGSLLVIDCDGCEEHLFDAATVRVLSAASVLVETHDVIEPGVTDRLLERFAATHSAAVIDTEPRWISDFPELEALPDLNYVDRELGITEFRPKQRWVVFTPNER
jgi:hypothetical protein